MPRFKTRVFRNGKQITLKQEVAEELSIKPGYYIAFKLYKGQEAVIFTTKVSTNNIVTLPRWVIKRLNIAPGDVVEMDIIDIYP